MDMKDLNKSQLILLALLISFITSIATGIVTVTLLQQAPTSVTTPINRIVRQTVEKIVPGVTTSQTVVVKEEDLVVDAIAKNKASIFSIIKDGVKEDGQLGEISAGKGFAVSNNNILVADGWLVSAPGSYYVENESGKFYADFITADPKGFAFLKIGNPLKKENKLSFTIPSVGDISKMKAGQKIIIYGGVISSFIYDGSQDLKISVPSQNAGGLLLDLDGNALGIALSGISPSFAPIGDIMGSLANLAENKSN